MKIIFPKFSLKVERWKWNKEYRVFVSTLGHIKDEYKRNVPIKISRDGYCWVLIPSLQCYKSVHRLVMLTWKPIPNAENLTIDHINHNKRENTVYNLEWVTYDENQMRAIQDFMQSLPTEPNMNKSGIYVDNKYFTSFERAAHWVLTLNHSPITDDVVKTVIKNIKNAISNNKRYCGKHWTIKM